MNAAAKTLRSEKKAANEKTGSKGPAIQIQRM
jgi:hypothetical protein